VPISKHSHDFKGALGTGNVLKVGDTVLGYDLTAANAAETAAIALKVLVRCICE